MNSKYDVIICGAGPVGLSAAIRSAQLRKSVLVIEKDSGPGEEIRGESMSSSHAVNLILGETWLQDHQVNSHTSRVFHSPGDLKQTEITIPSPTYFFPWQSLLQTLYTKAADLNCSFLFDTEVVSPVVDEEHVTGIRVVKGKREKEYKSDLVFNCMGHRDPFSEYYKINRNDIDCPTMKYLSSHAPGIKMAEYSTPQFYMIPPGALPYAQKLPPAIAYVFPLQEHRMEAGLMLRTAIVDSLKGIEIPDSKLFTQVWEELKESYPGFSSFFIGAVPDYEKTTVICNRSLVPDPVPYSRGGMILLGDITGFSDPNGSSGLTCGINQAVYWADRLLQDTRGSMEWDPSYKAQLLKEYHNWNAYRHIEKSYRDIRLAETLSFKTCGTPSRLNRFWNPLMKLLQSKTR